MLRIITIIAIMLAWTISAMAQRTTRPTLHADAAVAGTSLAADTIWQPDVAVSGYEKTLRSTRESFLATNLSTDTIASICVTINYIDMQGRQLHQRTLTLPVDLEPGQTRMLDFKSWDKQKVWHYRLSEPPRTHGQATPYDVQITVDYITTSPQRQ